MADGMMVFNFSVCLCFKCWIFLLGPKHSLAEFNKAASASYTQLNDNEKLQLQHDSHNKQEIVWTESKARARANKIFRKIKQQVLN